MQLNQYFFDNNGITEAKITEKDQTYQLIATQKPDQKPVVNIYPIEDTVKNATRKIN